MYQVLRSLLHRLSVSFWIALSVFWWHALAALCWLDFFYLLLKCTSLLSVYCRKQACYWLLYDILTGWWWTESLACSGMSGFQNGSYFCNILLGQTQRGWKRWSTQTSGTLLETGIVYTPSKSWQVLKGARCWCQPWLSFSFQPQGICLWREACFFLE